MTWPFRSRSTAVSRRGNTLLELTVALPIMAMLMLGLASAIKVSFQAVPDGTSISATTLTGSRAMDLLSADVTFATSITSDVTMPGASKSLTFTIPDRDGIAPTTETVTYSWSGVMGDPLLRTFNGTTTTVATNVQEFQLNYDKRTKSISTTQNNTSAQTLLISSDGVTAPIDPSITTTAWSGQYFCPLLPSNATGWNVTRVDVMAKWSSPATGTSALEIRTASNGLPTITVLGTANLLESTLSSSLALRSVTYAGIPMQAPTTGLCLVVRASAISPSAVLQYWAGGKPNQYYVSTANSGTAWTASSSNSLRYYVYGTYTTASAGTPSAQYLLTNVRCTLRAGSSTSSRLTASVRTLNEPQVVGP